MVQNCAIFPIVDQDGSGSGLSELCLVVDGWNEKA